MHKKVDLYQATKLNIEHSEKILHFAKVGLCNNVIMLGFQ